LPALEEQGIGPILRLPVSIRIVLESVLRNCDGKKVRRKDVETLANWKAKSPANEEIPFVVARIVLQDFTGVPLLVDLAAMRSAVTKLGKNPKIIEPLIAVSIIYVGVENIVRRDMDKRWLLAFGFGLVHGCGFASALRDLGIGSDGTGIVVPLFSFNLGVEICQMTIAALILPVIWKLRQRPQFVHQLVPAGSCLIALAGTWWLLQRTFF